MVIDLEFSATQQRLGEVFGISQQAVSDLESRGIWQRDWPAGQQIQAYCEHIREIAAGRVAAGELDLAEQRARLAKEQADRIAMQNAVTRRELAPVPMLEAALADTCRQIAAVLESIPVKLRRASDRLTPDDLELIEKEIAAARNIAADARLEFDTDPATDDSDSSSQGIGTAESDDPAAPLGVGV